MKEQRREIPAAKIWFPQGDRRELAQQIDEILASGQLTLGKWTKRFEDEFAHFTGTKYAVAVSSGTAALEIILRTIGVDGASVIVPTNTFVATPAAVIHAGGKVLFADVSDDLCLDPESVARQIRPDTKAVIVVHVGGVVTSRLRELQDLCEEHGLALIEDAAHAHGSTLDGKKAGTFGLAAAFSFYPTKVITSAEGGMITTDSEEMKRMALILRDQGKADFASNVHTHLGYNWRMSEIHAAIGVSQLRRIDEFIAARRATAKLYDSQLPSSSSLRPLTLPNEVQPNFYKYVALLPDGADRQTIKASLRREYGVRLSGEVYELPCHLQPVFRDRLGFSGGGFPNAERLCANHVCLPIYPEMGASEAEYVVDAVSELCP